LLGNASAAKVAWPDGKTFAFTIFDDPDSQTPEVARLIYGFLADHGIFTTKGVWPLAPRRDPSDHGATCGDPEFLAWLQALQKQGFEMGFHNATSHTSTREETREGLERFREYFGQYPGSMANHYFSREGIYFGEARLSGWRKAAYTAMTLGRRKSLYTGEIEGHENFWGDLCQRHIRYVRNFTFREINTLKICPWMPYYDPTRPFVNAWYASGEGANVKSLIDLLSERNQDRLEQEGGLCIAYTHFGHGFVEDGTISPRFRDLIRRLSRRPGWFAPVTPVLDHLRPAAGCTILNGKKRAWIETRWLREKMFHGTS
jgi:hypothetical protein